MKPLRIALLTGSELRHQFVRNVLAASPGIELSICLSEGLEQSLQSRADAQESDPAGILHRHAADRRQSEEDFFAALCKLHPGATSSLSVPKGEINDPSLVSRVASTRPDLIACYGSSLLKAPWIEPYSGRIINLHLGLSPYYRGSGTNFWAMAQGRFECAGATFMHLDAGIDTGAILHQLRARVYLWDSPHTIGNRLIADAALTFARVLACADQGTPSIPTTFANEEGVLCRRADFTPQALSAFYEGFASARDAYLEHQQTCMDRAPIVRSFPPSTN